MDGQRFDNLTRALAGGSSRRAVLRGLAGLAGGLVGLGGAGALAQGCRGAGRSCVANGQCCSGLCDTTNPDPFKRNKCTCPPGFEIVRGECKDPATDYQADTDNCGSAGNRCPIDLCNMATCANGVCGLAPNPLRVGKSCASGADLCTENAVCQADGACRGTPKNCAGVADACNDGVCRSSDGACVAQPKPNNTPCETGNQCTADTCQAGSCTQGPLAVSCPQPTQCQVSVSCNPANGLCDQVVNKGSGTPCGAGPSCSGGTQHAQDTCNANGTCVPGANTGCGLFVCGATACLTTCSTDTDCVGSAHCDGGVCAGDLPNGQPCDEPSDCQSGFCNSVSGFCCNQDCGAGIACSGAGFTCGAPPCGAVGQACCSGDVCNAGAHCDGGSCLANLANGTACDEPSDCQSGFCNGVSAFCCGQNCAAGVDCSGAGFTCGVPPCGAVGQACCAGEVCNSGAHCDGGSCVANLANGQACDEHSDCQSGICDATSGICCSQSCAAGVACTGAGFTCDDPSCGGPGQSCCAGNACDSGACSFNRRCEPCGDERYQVCCFDSRNIHYCNNGLFCPDGACWPGDCGFPNTPCCDGTRCQNGLVCDAGQVCRVPCGGNGQACCAGGTCGSGLVCDGQTCRPCGALNQACCAGDVCGAGLECGASFSGNLTQCVSSCGGSGETCCREGGAAVCDAGLECNSNARCFANGCGSPGQICCYFRECDAGAPCSINHICEPCGDLNQPCCFANVQYCNGGLVCPDRTCLPRP